MNIINRNKRGSITRDSGLRLFGLLMFLILFFAADTPKALAQEEMFVLPEAVQGKGYSHQLTNSGTAPYTWTVLEGEFPSPLTLTSDGKLFGNPPPTRPLPFRFKVSVTDSTGYTSTQWLSLVVKPPTSLIGRTTTVVPAPTPTPAPTPAPTPFILTASTADEETIALTQRFSAAPEAPDFEADASDDNVTRLQAIINGSIGTSTRFFNDGDYCVVHLIKWQPLNNENKSEPERELWALFQSNDLGNGNVEWNPLRDPKNKKIFSTRIFGNKRVVVLLVHLNTPALWDVKYKITVNQKIPTPIQNVLELASSVLGGAGLRADTKNIWGARLMMVKYTSSEMIVKVNTVSSKPSGQPIEQSKERTNTYVNEGRFHWDVSVGLPVQSVRQLQFKTDGNRVTTAAQGKQSVYGFLNIFPKAVDLKGDKFLTFPHFVFGVPLATKPLHRPFAGIGTGIYKAPIKFNIFAGIVFLRERVPRTLNEGDVATPSQLESDLRPRWVRKFMFGINIPIRQIKDAIKTN